VKMRVETETSSLGAQAKFCLNLGCVIRAS